MAAKEKGQNTEPEVVDIGAPAQEESLEDQEPEASSLDAMEEDNQINYRSDLDLPPYVTKSNGHPYATQKKAEFIMTQKRLNPETWEAVRWYDGWILRRKECDRWPPRQDGMEEPVYWVRFHERGDENQTQDVILSVNGDTLLIQRGVEVPVPERFLVCADNAKYPVYRIEPGKDREVTGWVQIYPYTKYRAGTWKQYKEFRRKGTEQTIKNMNAKHDQS